MNRPQLLLVGGLCLWFSAMAVTSRAETFDSQASASRWELHDGPEFPGAAGAIRWDAERGRAAPGCLVLEHSFEGGGNYVQASAPVPPGTNAKVARVWLKKPAGHRITFRVVDSAGQTFQKGVSYTSPDWQHVEVDLGRWGASFGGPGDNQLRPPLRRFGILIENTDSPKTGELLIDDLEFLPRPGRVGKPVTYTLLDFAQQPGGHLQGGAGNTLVNGTWTYGFNRGAPGFVRDFSLLGEPVLMRIHLESDGSGHGVRLELGSHFQSFHKQVGDLSGKGKQVIEVPLNKLDGWEHFGGSDDGMVRLPLRFRRLALIHNEAGPRTGTIRLHKIEVTTLPRDGQLVVLIPDVRQESANAVPSIRFSVKAVNLRPEPVRGRLQCDIRHLGGSLARQETSISLEANGGQAAWSMSHPMDGWKFIEAVFQWSDDDFTSKPVLIGTTALPADPGSPELMPENTTGVGLYLYRYRHHPNYVEPITRVCQVARRAGVKWTREEIQWHTTEPAEGRFEWKFYDDMIDTARAHGISVYGLLCYWSRWSNKDTPEGVEQYCRWVRQVVRRYKDRIKHWEIWNEPNIFFWSGPRELYAEMLSKAYDAIKAEDPDAQVLGCSTSGIDTEFIRKVMEWGGQFDALTIHPYRGVMNDLDFIRELQDVQQLVGGRDVWLTEMGFPSQLIDGWSERRQASLSARVYLCAAASGACRNISWYDFRNDGNDPFYNEMNFGLVRNDLRPKPGYGTLATFGRTVGHMTVRERINIGPDAYAFRFSDGRADVIALCAPDRARLAAYRATPPVRVINAFGETMKPVSISEAGENAASVVTLDAGFPVYLVGPVDFAFESLPAPIAWSIEPQAARAGETVDLRWTGTVPQADMLDWDLPQGWPQPRKTGPGTWTLVVPEHAPAYEFDIQALMNHNGTQLRLPLRIPVAPALIRI